MKRERANGLALVGVVLAMHALPAKAETYDTCNGFISTLPASIGAGGVYCLKQDLATSMSAGQAININANNVTLDCNGYKIGGLAAGKSTLTKGIYSYNKLNIIIRNCAIRGFHTGIQLDGDDNTSTGGHVVENNRFDLNTANGMNVQGDDSTVRGNFVLNTGGTTDHGYPRGIYSGGNVDIIDNTVAGVAPDLELFPGGGSAGIETSASESGSVVGNRVNGLVGNQVFGIYNGGGSGHVKVASNLVTGPSPAQNLAAGILCNNSSGIAKDNIVTGFTASYLLYLCTDGGGNVLQP